MRLETIGIVAAITVGSVLATAHPTMIHVGLEYSSVSEETGNRNLEMSDLVNLDGISEEELMNFCRRNGIRIHPMNQGKLDYTVTLKLYECRSTVCFEMDTGYVQEVYIRPKNTKLSVWVHRFTELYGECLEIERIPAKGQEMKCITWVYGKHMISIVELNQNMYIHITVCE